MAKVRVYNDNDVVHRERFKGVDYSIKPGEFIEMEDEDAVLLLGQFRSIVKMKSGLQTKESMKILRMVPIEKPGASKEDEKAHEHVCMKCGFKAQNKAGLSAHIRANHLESMVDDDAKKELQKGA